MGCGIIGFEGCFERLYILLMVCRIELVVVHEYTVSLMFKPLSSHVRYLTRGLSTLSLFNIAEMILTVVSDIAIY